VTSRAEPARRLSDLLAAPEQTAIFSDFDGTLAPIVDDPASARPLEGAVEALTELAGRMGKVGVISGRPAEFLLRHLGRAGISIWGLYGLEMVEDGEVVPAPEAEEWRSVVEEVVARAEEELGESMGVERKGLTLVLHYRQAPDRGPEAEEWAERTAESSGLSVHPGRMSYELRPPVPHGKGTVLEKASDGLQAACFFGDDLGDLDAFDALDRLAEKGLTTLRVAVASDEAPDELLDRADLTIDGPPGVLAAFRELAGGS
jgi:trehalose 6-phosphate phosphatase